MEDLLKASMDENTMYIEIMGDHHECVVACGKIIENIINSDENDLTKRAVLYYLELKLKEEE